MAISIAARKAKGRTFQNYTSDKTEAHFMLHKNIDFRTRIMGEAGTDLELLSEKAFKHFPFSVECKHDENKSVWHCWEQAEKNVVKNTKPVLFMKRNHKKPLAVMLMDDWFELMEELDRFRYPRESILN